MIIGNCRFADDVLYDTASYTWVRFHEDGTADIGISAILAWLGGPINSISFKPVGTEIEKGKSLGAIESPRHFETVRSPITGRLIEVNKALASNPRLLNRDPYGGGWFAKMKPLAKEKEAATLKSAALARGDLQASISQLKIRCFAEFPDYEMYEIGTECSAVLVRLDELLSTSAKETVIHLVSDDPASEIEMIRWSERTGNQLLETRKEGKLVHYIVKKTQP